MAYPGEDKDCFKCDWSGMDMDMEPYCINPTVAKKHPYGLVVNQALEKFCLKDGVKTLWKKRQPR